MISSSETDEEWLKMYDKRRQNTEDPRRGTGEGGRRINVLRLLYPACGFTFAELIVVLMIITVTLAVVVPKVGSNWKQIEDSDFLQQFTETIQRSRLFAMNSGQPVTFRLNGAERVYGFENPPRQPIPLNAKISSEHLQREPGTGDFLIMFHPDGSLVGNDLEVTFDEVRIYHIYIHPLFGTVSQERIK